MQTITAHTLENFRPTYPEYNRRRLKTAENVGVESVEDMKNFRAEIERWNSESAIGFNKQQTNIISLILHEEEGNRRFDSECFIDSELGGNTAEHPIFIGHKNDAVRDAAGFGPHTFVSNAQTLAAARLSQMLHARAALHDIGELVDISFAEQNLVKASYKEPPEEKLVGPFKILLASYAVSQRNPSLYIHTMHEARNRIRAKKQELFKSAQSGALTGDEFVAGVGAEIKAILDETMLRLGGEDRMRNALRPEYRDADAALSKVFEQSQEFGDFNGALFNMMDKIEGDAHYRHFIGRSRAPHSESTPALERLFNQGRALNYKLASSNQVVGSVVYAQKTIPPVFDAAEALPPGPEREVGLAYARAATAMMLRNHIRILQKAPALIDVSRADKDNATLTNDAALQQQEVDRRLGVQQTLLPQWKEARQERGYNPVTSINGTVSTTTLIAVFEKAATAIEQGKFKPSKKDMPIGFGALPPALHVTMADIVNSSRIHPIERFDMTTASRSA